ncbi:phage terminase large subunit family protein [Zooshikella marina]|uniref:phage terminase large subunit family protein n=1 Tax=Zooshikella ganghwensis TaxID=202772 RepID=UPI001BB00E68|nr:terminase gpA endonuclease subunit [Zooshikella ganghwensis]MBU2708930.1 phage terminase large subunit family protein [Zooshikella ganghwensis]
MHCETTNIADDVAEIIKPPSRLSVSEAVKQTLRVPKNNGNGSDPWSPEITPYIIEPLDCLNSREYTAVFFVGPARTGKTLAFGEGWLSYVIAHNPGDMLIVQIAKEKAQEYSKKRVDRAINCSPELAKRLSPRSHDNNVHDKIFRAGNYLKIGWPTKNILSSSDYKYVFLTDYDRLKVDIDTEGDPFTLAKKRTTTFMSSGMTVVESSPGKPIIDLRWEASTPHEAPPCQGILGLYNQGDRRRLYWPCPHCQEWFQPIFERLHWEKHTDPVKASESVYMRCPHCQLRIEPSQKDELNNQCRWLAEGQQLTAAGEVIGEKRQSRYASFWMEGPAAGYQTWQELLYTYLLAEQHYEQTGSQEKFKSVFNIDLGRPYFPILNEYQRTAKGLKARAEPLTKRTIPHGVRFLTAAIDVQAGSRRRFVVQVEGWGEGLERWLIDRLALRYSPYRTDEDNERLPIHPGAYAEDWDVLLDKVLNKAYPLADGSGRVMGIRMVACDSGGEDGVTDNAYAFYRKVKKQGLQHRFMLIKGDRHTQQKMRETFPDNTHNSQRKAKIYGDIPLQLLNTNLFKDALNNVLDRDIPGPKYFHFPDWLPLSFYEELTAETRNAEGKWESLGGPNEAWDLSVYNSACVHKLQAETINWAYPPAWAQPWDENTLVFDPEVTNLNEASKPKLLDLSALGRALG